MHSAETSKIPWEYSASNIVERAEKFPGALQGLPPLRTCANTHAIGFSKDILHREENESQ